jgi:hypothetical protein
MEARAPEELAPGLVKREAGQIVDDLSHPDSALL